MQRRADAVAAIADAGSHGPNVIQRSIRVARSVVLPNHLRPTQRSVPGEPAASPTRSIAFANRTRPNVAASANHRTNASATDNRRPITHRLARHTPHDRSFKSLGASVVFSCRACSP